MSRLITTSMIVIALLSITALSGTAATDPPTNIRVTNIPQLNNEEQVCICPTDSSVIIANWRDFRLGFRQIGVGRSIDGGLTWDHALIDYGMQYYAYEGWQSDPTMTVNAAGDFYMSALDFEPNGPGSVISFYKSIDKGTNWTGPVIHALSGPWFEDKQFTAVDRTGGSYNGNLYCSWTRFPNTDPDQIAFVRSINGGASFLPAVIVGPWQTSTGCGTSTVDAGQFSIPVVTPEGNVHVFWLGIALDSGGACTGRDVIKHVVSTDGGATFSQEDTVLSVSGWTTASGGVQTYSQPVVDADISGGPFAGNLYMTFTNIGPEDTDHSDVDFVVSTDGGVSWSSRYAINDDSNSVQTDNFHPWLICNEDGVVITIFYDQRFDIPNYYQFDLLAAYSFDGGLSFTTNHRISSASSSPDFLRTPTGARPWTENPDGTRTPVLQKPMAGRLGEYIGVAAFHDKVNAVWTDTRDGNSEVYTANWYLPLLPPRLQSPANSSTPSTTPLFTWSTSWKHDQDQYRLELFDGQEILIGSAVVDTPFYQWPAELVDSAYTWRVKAFDLTSGDSSEFSPVWRIRYPCCFGIRGNIDGDGGDITDISDLSAMVDYLFFGGAISVCMPECDVDESGTVDISDLQVLIDFLFSGGTMPGC